MNLGPPPGGFPWSQLFEEQGENAQATPDAQDDSRAPRGGRRDGYDDMYELYQAMLRSWGTPWLNVPHHGGPRHGGPHHDGPHHGDTHHGGPPHHTGRHGPPREGTRHHGGPHHGGPHHGPPHFGPPHHGPPHRGPLRHDAPPPPGSDKPDGEDAGPSSRSPSPSTPPTPPEELPEYPGFPHPHRHHHGHRGRGRGPRHGEGPSCHRGNGFGGGRYRGHRNGGNNGPFPSWTDMILNNVPQDQRKTMADNLANIFGWSETETQPVETSDGFTPDVDVFDKADRIVIFASLPGAKKSEIDVTYNLAGHKVTISGVIARSDEVDEEMMQGLRENGRKIGFFTKTVDLPGSYIDSDEMTAKLEDGVLRVEIPKPSDAEWEDVKKVPIN